MKIEVLLEEYESALDSVKKDVLTGILMAGISVAKLQGSKSFVTWYNLIPLTIQCERHSVSISIGFYVFSKNILTLIKGLVKKQNNEIPSHEWGISEIWNFDIKYLEIYDFVKDVIKQKFYKMVVSSTNKILLFEEKINGDNNKETN